MSTICIKTLYVRISGSDSISSQVLNYGRRCKNVGNIKLRFEYSILGEMDPQFLDKLRWFQLHTDPYHIQIGCCS